MNQTGETARPRRRHWPWVALPLLGGLLLVFYKYLDGAAQGLSEPFWNIFAKEISGVVGTILLLAPLVSLHRRFPLSGPRVARHTAVHVAGVMAYSAVHTTWNWGVRTLLYRGFDLGVFNYGHIPTRYLMEFPMDMIVYTIVGVVVAVVARTQSARAREVQVVRLQEQLQRTQLAQLQSQLRPHFLFNSLNTISSAMYDDVDKADGVLQALADLLRKMVDQSRESVVPLQEELRLAESFMEIQEARFSDRLKLSVHVDRGMEDWPVPPLILQPLVENAVQHGMPNGEGTLEVRIQAAPHQGRLQLSVEDDGRGWVGGLDARRNEGVGLRSTRERLETQYGDSGAFSLSRSAAGGARITMEIPWIGSAR